MKKHEKRVLCLVWAPFSPRMDELSQDIGAKRVTMSLLFGRRNLAPLRYLILFLKTGLLLLRERPRIVYAQNPPIFCPLSCLPYCKIWKTPLIVDHHAVWSTKTLGSGLIGKSIRRVEKFIVTRAFANTTPHALWSKELVGLGAKQVITIFDYVPKSKRTRDQKLHDEFSKGRRFLILAPHGGHPLERIESEVSACSSLENVYLLISGSPSKLQKRIDEIKEPLPENAKYIGFIPKEEYEQLKASIDLGLCITDEPYTVSHSLLEFAACSTPVVSSKQAAVELLFGDSIVYVDSSEPSVIASAIKRLVQEENLLQIYANKIAERQKEVALQRQKAMNSFQSLISKQV